MTILQARWKAKRRYGRRATVWNLLGEKHVGITEPAKGIMRNWCRFCRRTIGRGETWEEAFRDARRRVGR